MKTSIVSLLLTLAMILGFATITEVSAQGIKKYGETPEDSTECIMNLSLYSEFYKQWKASGYKNASISDAIVRVDNQGKVVFSVISSGTLVLESSNSV